MDANMVLPLGLGMRPPWRLVECLDTGKQPHEVHLDVCAERGSLFACPACGKAGFRRIRQFDQLLVQEFRLEIQANVGCDRFCLLVDPAVPSKLASVA